MSDWVIDDSPQESEKQKISNPQDWEIVNEEISKGMPESKLKSASLAIPRILVDTAKHGYEAIKSIPYYYESAKTEVPGAFNVIKEHPAHAGSQALAGLAEFGKNAFNLPHDVINYMSQRLNLVPQDINKIVQMGRMPEDTQEAINKTFGQPQYAGENLIRGIPRNALNIVGGGFLGKTLNPLQLTNKGTAKSVVNALNKQVDKHSKMYNKLWDKAESQGFNEVPYDKKLLEMNHDIIDRYYPEKSTLSLKALLENPTLENAQAAQSDLGILRRSLDEKVKSSPLLESEKALYKVLDESEKHIENNMFKNKKGELNSRLANEYKKVTKSYRENVVPYKYNPDIQDYIKKNITAKQLIKALNQGPFAAQKGGFLTHPQFGIRNALIPILGGVGVLGSGSYLYDKAIGNASNPMAETK